ncbi:procathepsin L-like [Cydia splendana]|uniref:procathepsin L-like n=1 Tax=Cydia splendana TaxID=1100963 RepID=UPI0028F4BA49
MKGMECVKFTGSYGENEVTNEELWAYYNHSAKSWVPVRYETRTSDTRHGYLKDHQIVDYFNFSPEVNKKVFKLYKKYTCIKSGYDDYDVKKVPNSNYLESMTGEEKNELDEAFAEYKQKFNKQYSHQAEHEMRKSIFREKWRLVKETNRKNLSYTLALNKMSDRTKKELKRYKGLRRNKPRSVGNIRFPYSHEEIKKISETLPSQYDLRLEGVVGPVLDQDSCGSCWTFGTTAAVEGALARSKGGMLISLSNQALLDCSWGMGNAGCDGGDDISAYKWIMKHGLPTVAEYGPYSKQDGYCNIENMTTTYKIRGWTDVTPLSEQALKIALINHGPLSVSIDAEDAFTHYDGGILYDTECKYSKDDMNHEVTLVGYGEKDGEPYWIIRNSYGPYWGIDGYVHISTRNNNCGVMTEPTYVVVE